MFVLGWSLLCDLYFITKLLKPLISWDPVNFVLMGSRIIERVRTVFQDRMPQERGILAYTDVFTACLEKQFVPFT